VFDLHRNNQFGPPLQPSSISETCGASSNYCATVIAAVLSPRPASVFFVCEKQKQNLKCFHAVARLTNAPPAIFRKYCRRFPSTTLSRPLILRLSKRFARANSRALFLSKSVRSMMFSSPHKFALNRLGSECGKRGSCRNATAYHNVSLLIFGSGPGRCPVELSVGYFRAKY